MNWPELLASKKTFNGQPISHWQKEADELVMDQLLHAAANLDAKNSIIGFLAQKQLLQIAERHNRTLFREVRKKRGFMQDKFRRLVLRVING